ncbi:MAG: glycosyltransferase family 2 protein [Anaerolineaceae bacterium]|nr:glycosyltransferase family 2 protein [Anaerolineaceae bacterium]
MRLNKDLSIKISIIIVGYNSWADLKRCLPSVFLWTDPDVEVIVVDNGSSDETLAELPNKFPSVKLIIAKENSGFGAGCNLGAEAALGEYLVFLNPDTLVSQDALRELISPLEIDPDVGMTTPKILQMDHPTRINTCGNDVHLSGLALCRGMNEEASKYTLTEEVNSISGAAFAIKKDYFFELGAFDPAFFLYVEDTDLSLRCLLNGKRIVYVPNSVIYHDYKLTFGPKKVYYQERNRNYMLQKLFSKKTLHSLAPVLCVADFMTWGFCILHGKREIQNKLDAKKWLRENSELISSRHASTESIRKVADYQVIKQFGWKVDFRQTVAPLPAILLSCFFYPIYYICTKVVLWSMNFKLKD